MSNETCRHLAEITTIRHASGRVCEECVRIGSRWVHLRICQTCGATLCCDDSPNRHATGHARASGHRVIASAELASAVSTAIPGMHSRNAKRQISKCCLVNLPVLPWRANLVGRDHRADSGFPGSWRAAVVAVVPLKKSSPIYLKA